MNKAARVERAGLYAAKYADALAKEAQNDEHTLVALFDAWERMGALPGARDTLAILASRLAWHSRHFSAEATDE